MSCIGSRSEDAADLEPAQYRQVEIENDQIGRAGSHGFQRGIAAADDLGVGAAASFERVFDETGDVLFVFDDEHAVLLHVVEATLVVRGFASVSKLLNLGYRSLGLACYSPR